MKSIISLASVAAVLLSGSALAAPACKVSNYAAQANAIIAPYIKSQAFTGSILVAKDGVPLLRQGYAMADREWDIANTPDTKFRLGSITKQFTAAAILLLAQDGKLSIDDPVSKFYPDAPAAWSRVTIKHLLTHTSGIPSYTSIPGFFDKAAKSAMTPAEIVKLTQEQPLEFEPGSKFNYDNTGYVLLGVVIEKASGLTYADFLRSRIFVPLGMKDTGYDVSQTVLHHRAKGYGAGPSGELVNADYLDMSVPYAAGALYSTVDDLSTWDRAIVAGKLLQPGSWRAAFTDYGHGYGYGWFLDKLGQHRRIQHGGGIHGFSTAFQRYPDEGLAVVVLGNSMSAQSERIARQLAQLCFGEYKPPTIVSVPLAQLDRYVGTYALSPETPITVWRVGSRMFTQVKGQPPVEIFPKAQDTFFAGVVDADFTFPAGGAGPAATMTLKQWGNETKAPRIP
jgi:CubicO group peptidase (beta-lactamase class C family)